MCNSSYLHSHTEEGNVRTFRFCSALRPMIAEGGKIKRGGVKNKENKWEGEDTRTDMSIVIDSSLMTSLDECLVSPNVTHHLFNACLRFKYLSIMITWCCGFSFCVDSRTFSLRHPRRFRWDSGDLIQHRIFSLQHHPLLPTCSHQTETGRDAGTTSGISNHGDSDHAVSHCSFWFQLWDFGPVYIWNKTVYVWSKTQRGHFSSPFKPTCSSVVRARPSSIWDRLLSAKLAWFELPHNI